MLLYFFVESPEAMNPQREAFAHNFCRRGGCLERSRGKPRCRERSRALHQSNELLADPTQAIETVDSGLCEIVSLLEDFFAIEQATCEAEYPTPEPGQCLLISAKV